MIIYKEIKLLPTAFSLDVWVSCMVETIMEQCLDEKSFEIYS